MSISNWMKNVPASPPLIARQAQVAILLLVSVTIVFGAPQVWNFKPDSGVYIGSAVSMLEVGQYWFNGHPNLLYYPGTSALLTIPIALFGMNFHAMHILFALLAVATLWLSRAYFPVDRYGWIGLLLPLLLAANELFQAHSQLILSDIAFLNLVLLALFLWQRFGTTGDERWLVACALVVALSPMFRFQGLFLVGAFGLSMITHIYRHREAGWPFAIRCLGIASLVLLPFLIWTLRNYQLHTADTYNMANRAFFGLSGLNISGEGFGEADWIDADWKYPIYQILYLFGGLGNTFLGEMHDHLPLELVTAFVLGLVALGCRPWLRQAGIFETAFVLASTLMLVQQAIGGKSLYIVTRYWLPLLPFFIVIAGLGIRYLGQILAGPNYRKVVTLGTSALTLTLLAVGAASWADRLSLGNSERMAHKYDVTIRITDYARNNLPPSAILLSSDWGVVPLMTGRHSYKYLRSSCHKPTLELILEKRPSHLVITPRFIETTMAQAMADAYPEIFRPLFTAGGRERGDFGGVYAIDLKQLKSIISEIKCPSEYSP